VKELGSTISMILLVTALCFIFEADKTARFFAGIVNTFNDERAKAVTN
jgi:hypothetical protein